MAKMYICIISLIWWLTECYMIYLKIVLKYRKQIEIEFQLILIQCFEIVNYETILYSYKYCDLQRNYCLIHLILMKYLRYYSIHKNL